MPHASSPQDVVTALIGESVAVDKTTSAVCADSQIGDRACMAFKGNRILLLAGLSAEIKNKTSERLEHWKLWLVCVIDYAACF